MSVFYVGHPKEEDLALFAGGELGPLARWRIEKHVETCENCQEIVADYFHLQSSLSDLASLPAVDWNTMARQILARAGQRPASDDRQKSGWFSQPVLLRWGLATATLFCALVVVNHLQWFEKAPRQTSPTAAESEAGQLSVEAGAEWAKADRDSALAEPLEDEGDRIAAPQAETPEEEKAEAVVRRPSRAPAGNVAENEGGGVQPPVARARQELPVDEFAPGPPASQKKDKQGSSVLAQRRAIRLPASASRENENIESRETGQKPEGGEEPIAEATTGESPQPTFRSKPESNLRAKRASLEKGLQASSGDRRADSAEIAVGEAHAERQLEDSAGSGRAVTASANRRTALLDVVSETAEQRRGARRAALPGGGAAGTAGLAIEPVSNTKAVDVVVGADGWISFRAIDAETGRVLITQVYAP